MDNYTADQVLNGTWGEMWLNGDLMAETTALQAKVTLTKTAVNLCGTLVAGQKVTGMELKGTLKMNKVSSAMIKANSANIKLRKNARVHYHLQFGRPTKRGRRTNRSEECHVRRTNAGGLGSQKERRGKYPVHVPRLGFTRFNLGGKH